MQRIQLDFGTRHAQRSRQRRYGQRKTLQPSRSWRRAGRI